MDAATDERRTGQAALLARIARRDGEALRAYHADNAAWVMGLARRILGDGHEAEDVTQEAFVRVWRQAHTYRPERGSPDAWLTFLVRNLAIDRLRVRRRTPALPLPDGEAGPAEDSCIQFIDTSDCVQQALGGLSPAQREVIELSFFGGLTGPEIATRTGLSLGNVKNHLRRALSRLRERIFSHD